ncbi:MAG: polymerase primary sigma factor [Solirubrobacteraceae bacterium]|nr:polymerase primary sigma factor [Solirubrobacteraceae bacterium]
MSAQSLAPTLPTSAPGARPARSRRAARPAWSPPSPGAERPLLLAAREHCGAERDELVESFMPLIASVARGYRGSTAVDRRELMQEGVVGLLRALERYDPEFGTPFWAYASWWVRQAMQQLVAELTRPVVLSDRALRQLARVKHAQRTYVQAHGREPHSDELAADSGLTRDQVGSLFAAERKARGLEEPIGGDGEVSATFGELLADPRAEDAYERVSLRPAVDQLPRLLGDLTERERMIVRARYGLDGTELTLRQLADRLGVSAERVRQIEQGALDKLRAAVGCDDVPVPPGPAVAAVPGRTTPPGA